MEHGIPANRFNVHCWITGEPEIGEGTWIGAFTLIDGRGGLQIGRGCDIACGVQIVTHSTVRRCVSERRYNRIDCRPTVIEDHVFIGAHAVVLMGCRIGHHSVIAAGAVVLEGTTVAPYSLVAGVPARTIRCIRADVCRWQALGEAAAADVPTGNPVPVVDLPPVESLVTPLDHSQQDPLGRPKVDSTRSFA